MVHIGTDRAIFGVIGAALGQLRRSAIFVGVEPVWNRKLRRSGIEKVGTFVYRHSGGVAGRPLCRSYGAWPGAFETLGYKYGAPTELTRL